MSLGRAQGVYVVGCLDDCAAFVHHNTHGTDQRTYIPRRKGQDAEDLKWDGDSVIGSHQNLLQRFL